MQLRLDEIRQKQERLTDALIDRLIDQETFQSRKEALVMDEARLTEQIAEIGRTRQNPQEIRKLLELLKSLDFAYQIAAAPEKQAIARITTSNRQVIGRNVELEPSNWLMDLQRAADVRFGGPCRGTDRTFDDAIWKITRDFEAFKLVAALATEADYPIR